MKKYLNSISAFQIYQLIRYSILILVGVVFTKTNLSQSEIGQYETFIFIAGALSFFWLNGLLKALLPLSGAKKDKTEFFSAFILIQLFSILAALFLFLLEPLLNQLLLNNQEITLVGWLILFLIFSVPANLVEYYYLIQKKNTAIVIYAAISFTIQLILVVTPALLNYGINLCLQGLVLSSVLRYVWLWALMLYYKELSLSISFVKEHLKLGGPLIGATLLSGSAQFVDGFIISSRFDEETFAVFRYGARELPLVMILANALSNAMLPAFANKNDLEKNLAKIKSSVLKLCHYLFPATILLLLSSHVLFPVVFNPEFKESATIFNIYLLLIVSRLMLPQTILNGLRMGKPILTASFFELLINITLSLILVQYYGIAGVAFATVVAYLFEKIYLVYTVRNRLNIRLSDYLPLNIFVLYSLSAVVIFIFAQILLG